MHALPALAHLLADTVSKSPAPAPPQPGAFSPLVDLLPEAALLLGAIACLVLAATRRATGVRTYQWVSGFAIVAAVGLNFAYLKNLPTRTANPGYIAYANGLVVDRFTLYLSAALCAFAFFTVLLGTLLGGRIRTHLGEYHAFVLLATLAGLLLVSTREMISMWMALELLSVSLVLLVGTVKTSRPGGEATLKLLVAGLASSGVLLYGLALLYGVGGSTDLIEVAHTATHANAATILAMALVVLGLLGKIGVVPFQRLLTDVFQGAPAPVVGFMGSVAVTAVTGLFLRVTLTAFPGVQQAWTALVALLGALAMLYGGLLALRQRGLRRLLGHLLLAQVGVMLMGVLGWRQSDGGIPAVMLSLASGGFAVLAVAAVLTMVESVDGRDDLDAYRGLSRRSPGAAAALAVALLSLAGLPPTVGFFSRLLTMESAVTAGYAWLLVVALVAMALGAVAALRVLRVVFAAEPDADSLPLEEPTPARVALAVCGIAVIGLAAAVQPLLALAGGGASAVISH